MKSLMKKTTLAVSMIALMGINTTSSWADSDKTLLFGVVPQQAASRLAKLWVPLMDKLSEQTGYNIKFATMKDIPSFEECLAQGAYDIAYMNPYHYTVYSANPGYSAFAHQADKKLKGIIVAHKDSKVNSLDDLKDAKVAFPSPAAFGASVLPRAEMRKLDLGIDPQYVKSHDSVYRAVAAKLLPAGGGVTRTFANADEKIKDQLKVIYTTNGYTPHAFAFGPEMDKTMRWDIEVAFTKIMAEEKQVFKKLGMRGIEIAADQDWDDVRSLNLTSKQTEIKKEGELKCRFD